MEDLNSAKKRAFRRAVREGISTNEYIKRLLVREKECDKLDRILEEVRQLKERTN